MNPDHCAAAADILIEAWSQHRRMKELPEPCRPRTLDEGYATQDAFVERSGRALLGWKIAATSTAGQKHIGVDGPLAGPLLAGRVHDSPSRVDIRAHGMKLVEVEFAFRMAGTLVPRAQPYTVAEVMAAAGTLHCGLEIPDSRYDAYERKGAAQLAADLACACEFVLGPVSAAAFRGHDLAAVPVQLQVNGVLVASGQGANALGDPAAALTWLANELSRRGRALEAGSVVTTGTCVVPTPVVPGDLVVGVLGTLARAEVQF